MQEVDRPAMARGHLVPAAAVTARGVGFNRNIPEHARASADRRGRRLCRLRQSLELDQPDGGAGDARRRRVGDRDGVAVARQPAAEQPPADDESCREQEDRRQQDHHHDQQQRQEREHADDHSGGLEVLAAGRHAEPLLRLDERNPLPDPASADVFANRGDQGLAIRRRRQMTHERCAGGVRTGGHQPFELRRNVSAQVRCAPADRHPEQRRTGLDDSAPRQGDFPPIPQRVRVERESVGSEVIRDMDVTCGIRDGERPAMRVDGGHGFRPPRAFGGALRASARSQRQSG